MQPTLSVLMTNYNHAHYIKEALNAILNQSYNPTEIIIIDDASTDNSIDILTSYARKYPQIKLICNEKNNGGLKNVDRLLELAIGDYVYFAAADDKILPGFFQKFMDVLARNPQAGLCSSLTRCIDVVGQDTGVLPTTIISNVACFIPSDKALSLVIRYGSWMQGNTVVYRSSALRGSGGFNHDLLSYCDGFVQLAIAAKYGVCYIPEALTAWRRLEDTYSASISKDSQMFLQVLCHAEKLMRTEYKSIFPSDFIDIWKKREFLNYRLMRFLDQKNDSLKILQEMTPSKGLADKWIFKLIKLFAKIEYVFLKIYLYRRASLPTKQLFINRWKIYGVRGQKNSAFML